MKELFIKLFINIVLSIIKLIDYIPEYIFSYNGEKKRVKAKNEGFSKISNPKDPSSPYKTCEYPDTLRVNDINSNIFDEFEISFKQNAKIDLFGVREIISIENEKQANGKTMKKYVLGDYKWQTYEAVYKRINNFSNGLLSIGVKSKQNLILYSETRPEWIISALSCFRINVPVITLYATLGTDGLCHGLKETESKYIISSIDQMNKIEEIIDKIEHNLTIIVINSQKCDYNLNSFKNRYKNIKVYEMNEIELIGEKIETHHIKFEKPKKDDLAVVMYTSGSTGNPKGVMLTHGNIIASLRTYPVILKNLDYQTEIYIGFLPLAHILELVCELSCIISSIRIGYSSPLTLTDNSTGIKKGQRGDINVLRPTIMATVPLILERICKAIQTKIQEKGYFARTLFETAFNQKYEAIKNGYNSWLLDKLIFNKMNAAVLGGRLKVMYCGGALLNENIQKFVQVCLAPVHQAYALTETCAGGTAQGFNDHDINSCGSVMQYCQIRLINWEEGGYHNTDRPNPRGEIHIGGDSVSIGYYKLPEISKETFYVHNGVRYCATGDIGELQPNGTFRIIDRKKDLVKLQGGEYVSLNNVETCLKLMPFIENCCVYANPLYSFCVAFICPNLERLQEFCFENDIKEIISLKSSSNSHILHERLLPIIKKHCLKNGISNHEIPAKIKIVEEVWLPDTGLVTDSFKLKRKAIENFYRNNLKLLYQ